VVEVVAIPATDDPKELLVIAWSEIDQLWRNALDTHNAGKVTGKTRTEGTRSSN
jgi:hypothetical protein